MAKKGVILKDLGLENIIKEMEKLKSLCVKVGVTEDVGSQTTEGGATLAQIAQWNELGVKGPPYSENGGGVWFIPPRSFVRGWADGKRELIAKTEEKLGDLVTGGKLDAKTAIRRLGEFGQNGIKSYINKDGSFTPNADSTKAKKNSSKPLIDTGNLRESIRYQIIEKPVAEVSEK